MTAEFDFPSLHRDSQKGEQIRALIQAIAAFGLLVRFEARDSP
jgi:hypothetical protein